MDRMKPRPIVGTNRNAILYEEDLDIRFSDLDPYGHVNSKHYLDYVLASRWMFLARKIKFTIEDCLAKGLGFYLIRSEIDYKRPILGTDRIRVQSYTSSLEKVRLTVTFEILDCKTEKKVFAVGTLQFAIMDTISNRPQACPEWALDLFSEKPTA